MAIEDILLEPEREELQRKPNYPTLFSILTFNLSCSEANYMDNWKCTGILKGDGSPLSGSSGQPTAMSTVVGSSVQTSQNLLNGTSAGR